jgi:hypothetical protein
MANEPVNTNNEPVKETDQKTSPDTADFDKRIKELEAENRKLKDAVTNASADASKWKKQMQEKDDALKARMSEDEKAQVEKDAADAAMRQELEQLRTERNIANYVSALVANDIGMDAVTAKAVAEALNAGETEKVFDGIRKFVTAHDKSLREGALKNNQTLPGGAADKTVTREEFKAMSYKQMVQFKNDHPDLYQEYMNN